MAVISDSSPLIALAQIGRIEILYQLHPNVLVPPAVAKEVAPTIPELPGWILVHPLAHPRQPHTVTGSIGLANMRLSVWVWN